MNRPIRVLHVIPSLARTGGVARFVYTMARNHNESRVHYDFLHHDTHNGRLLNELTYEPELEAMGAKVFYAEKAGLDFGRFVKDVDSFFDRHGCDYDVVHCHMPNAAFCVLRDAKALRGSRPCIAQPPEQQLRHFLASGAQRSAYRVG